MRLALRYEITRILQLRSIWILAVVALVVASLLAVATGVLSADSAEATSADLSLTSATVVALTR